jgi:hypothetical protein
MTRKSAVPEVSGVDLKFRPPSYFWPLDLATHLLARIKGAERRAALKKLIDAKRLDQIPDFLAQSALSDGERQAIGRIHPAFIGGEYLPDLLQKEVAIMRITIASTTHDVTSVYARRGKNRIYYRVVDEYDGDTLSGRSTRTSARPLSLGELEAFFNGAWSIFDVLAMNFRHRGYDRDDLLGFVVDVESQFYPQIGELYERRIEAWGAAQRERLALDRLKNAELSPSD